MSNRRGVSSSSVKRKKKASGLETEERLGTRGVTVETTSCIEVEEGVSSGLERLGNEVVSSLLLLHLPDVLTIVLTDTLGSQIIEGPPSPELPPRRPRRPSELKARLLVRSPELEFVASLPSGHVTSISTGIYDPDLIDEYSLPPLELDLVEEDEGPVGSR